ncbi:DUF2231 domain-containing protein [Gammaproteobacteria bacterium]|jgi:hypothetical protein|nr:DUF2231 domain-containing protein [Gammaproteobacteria bacterium]
MKKNINQTQRQGWLTLFALVIIAFAVSIGFTPLFELIGDGIAARIIGSSFGAIFVIILTMFLLNKQTEIDQESKKSERVFDEKVKIYQKILDICRDMLMDGKLTQEEINRLPFPLIRLQMLADDQVIEAFQEVFNKLNKIYNDVDDEIVEILDDDKNEIYESLSKFSGECRKDLEISNTPINDSIQKATVQTISQSNKKNDQTKFKFDGKMLPKSQYVYTVITNYLGENPQLTLEQFKDLFFDRDFDGNRKGQYEAWKTYKEIMDIHNSGVGTIRFYVSNKAKDIGKNKDKVIKLIDEEICLSNFWAIGSIAPFKELMKSKNIRVE